MSETENYLRLVRLNERTLWVRAVTGIGAAVTCAWVIYHSLRTDTLLETLVGLVFLGLIYWLGIAPLFAVVASLLCFYFHLVGWWLPAFSYVPAAYLLYMDLMLDFARRKAAHEAAEVTPIE